MLPALLTIADVRASHERERERDVTGCTIWPHSPLGTTRNPLKPSRRSLWTTGIALPTRTDLIHSPELPTVRHCRIAGWGAVLQVGVPMWRALQYGKCFRAWLNAAVQLESMSVGRNTTVRWLVSVHSTLLLNAIDDESKPTHHSLPVVRNCFVSTVRRKGDILVIDPFMFALYDNL